MIRNPTITVPCIAGFLASIFAANYLTAHYGFIPVGFGLTATAGTFAAGLALGLRDVIQDGIGRVGVVLLILLAALLSYAVAPALAVASGVAFLFGEMVDFGIYTPLRTRVGFAGIKWARAVIIAGLFAAVVDTVLFLTIAFGREAVTAHAVAGQLVGKGWALLIVIAVARSVRPLWREDIA